MGRRLTLILMLALATTVSSAQAVPEIAFDSLPDPLKLPPDIYLGEVAGVAVNSKGHVFVLSRGNTTGPAYGAAAAQLLEFDASGNFVREIGHGLYAWSFAHAVRVDRNVGDPACWTRLPAARFQAASVCISSPGIHSGHQG